MIIQLRLLLYPYPSHFLDYLNDQWPMYEQKYSILDQCTSLCLITHTYWHHAYFQRHPSYYLTHTKNGYTTDISQTDPLTEFGTHWQNLSMPRLLIHLLLCLYLDKQNLSLSVIFQSHLYSSECMLFRNKYLLMDPWLQSILLLECKQLQQFSEYICLFTDANQMDRLNTNAHHQSRKQHPSSHFQDLMRIP